MKTSLLPDDPAPIRTACDVRFSAVLNGRVISEHKDGKVEGRLTTAVSTLATLRYIAVPLDETTQTLWNAAVYKRVVLHDLLLPLLAKRSRVVQRFEDNARCFEKPNL